VSVIEFKNVSFSYPRSGALLQEIDLEVRAGEFLGIIGPNGSGKSTLLKMMLGLLRPTLGEVRVLGSKPRLARARIGYVPQFANFPKRFPITVMQTVLMGRLRAGALLMGYSRHDHEVAEAALERVGVVGLRDRPIGDLSGGEIERVLIARALATEPEILRGLMLPRARR
jgi:zinc transport system ATP-binding protein